jgi:hypothetical protein
MLRAKFSQLFLATALATGTAFVCGDLVHAQTGPANSGSGSGPIAGSGPAKVVNNPGAPKMLAPDALADYLRKQNYKVQVNKGTDGRPILMVQIEQNGWKYDVEVEYQPNLNSFYLLCRFGKAGAQLPSAQLAELLKANQKYAPTYFSIWPDGRLVLEDLWSTQMDTAGFQSALNRFLGRIQETHPLWDNSRWSMPGAAAAASN